MSRRRHAALQPKEPRIRQLLTPFQEFTQSESSSGIILIICTVFALAWANSPWSYAYVHLWETHFALGAGSFEVDQSLHNWINDGLMALFFFLIGLELKRELLVGELASIKHSLLPLIAALGGAIVPALIYAALNMGTAGATGWVIPMATDTAFTLGILALLGSRIPLNIKVFLTAFAIFDDIIAVVIIAIFYNHGIHWLAFGMADLLLLLVIAANLLDIRSTPLYILLGVALWMAILQSGIHATIAGILVALVIPARPRITASTFTNKGKCLIEGFEQEESQGFGLLMNERQEASVHKLEGLCADIQTPLQRTEHALNYFVSYCIVPLFVIANAGVRLNTGFTLRTILSPITIGIILGLVFGKQIGIMFFSWLIIRLKLSDLPEYVTWPQFYGVSWLGGLGFTMSLFIASLAFAGSDPTLLNQAKVGILIATLITGAIGYLVLRLVPTAQQSAEPEIASA